MAVQLSGMKLSREKAHTTTSKIHTGSTQVYFLFGVRDRSVQIDSGPQLHSTHVTGGGDKRRTTFKTVQAGVTRTTGQGGGHSPANSDSYSNTEKFKREEKEPVLGHGTTRRGPFQVVKHTDLGLC